MSMRISLELQEKDLEHFRQAMQRAKTLSEKTPARDIAAKARETLEKVQERNLTGFIGDRLGKLEAMLNMLEDKHWKIGDYSRERVLSALAYFSDPEDMIPDDIPGIGFLDDAIMMELVVRELKHELEAYDDFVAYRENEAHRLGQSALDMETTEWLRGRRQQLKSRMRNRRSRKPRRSRSGRGTSFSLW